MPRLEGPRTLLLVILLLFSTILYLQISRRCNVDDRPGRISPRPKIAITTMTLKETSYDWLSISNKYTYAKKNNYDLKIDFKGPGPWDKLLIIERAIKENQFDWIWWLDYDTLITNQSIKLEEVIEEALRDEKHPENIDLIVTSDCFPLNAGSMLFRATPWVLDFFQKTWRCGMDYGEGLKPSEQDCFRDLILNNTLNAGDKTVAVKQWKINANPDEIMCYDQDEKPWEKGMFVLNLAGARTHMKNSEDPVGDLMRKYSPSIIAK